MSRSATSAPRSGRTWKAVAAAGAAVALLAAGGATFAEWSDAETVDSSATITAGQLTINAPEAGSWTNVHGTDVTEAVTTGDYRIVPGDSLTYREDLDIIAAGDLLTATVTAEFDGLTGNEALREKLATSATMTLNDTTQSDLEGSLDVTEGEHTLAASVTLDFDQDTAELVAQGAHVDLADVTFTVRQNSVTAGN